MIVDLLLADHRTGQEIFAVVGNAVQPGWEERAERMGHLAALWAVHGATLEQVVFARLGEAATDAVQAIRAMQRDVASLAEGLARRASDGDADGRWLADFEGLKSAFDAQCRREVLALFPLIRDGVAPAEVAAMTHEAQALRASG